MRIARAALYGLLSLAFVVPIATVAKAADVSNVNFGRSSITLYKGLGGRSITTTFDGTVTQHDDDFDDITVKLTDEDAAGDDGSGHDVLLNLTILCDNNIVLGQSFTASVSWTIECEADGTLGGVEVYNQPTVSICPTLEGWGYGWGSSDEIESQYEVNLEDVPGGGLANGGQLDVVCGDPALIPVLAPWGRVALAIGLALSVSGMMWRTRCRLGRAQA